MGPGGRADAHDRRGREPTNWGKVGAIAAVLAIPIAVGQAIASNKGLFDDLQAGTLFRNAPAYSVRVERQGSGVGVTPHPVTSASALPAPPTVGQENVAQWARHAHLADACFSRAVVTVQARGEVALVINRIDIAVTRRGQPLDGSIVEFAGGGESQAEADINLDASPPTLSYQFQNRRVPHLDVVLHNGDSLDVWVIARTRRHRVDWRGTLSFAVNGRERTASLGQFETTSMQRAIRHSAFFPGSGNNWLHKRAQNYCLH